MPVIPGSGASAQPAPAADPAPAARRPGGVARTLDLRRMLGILDDLPVAVFQVEIDAAGHARALYVAPQVRSILGVTAEDILADASTRHRHIHPDDAPGTRQRVAERQALAVAGETYDPMDARRYIVDGQVRWVRVISHGAPPSADGVVLWTGYYEDVTDRKTEELALRQANEEQDAILESATSGICFTRGGRVLRANAALLAMLRSTPQALGGRAIADLYADPTYGQHLAQSINPPLARGETFRMAVRLRRDDASDFWAHISGHAVDAPDLARGVVWMVEDVTERLQAQQALVQAKEQAEDAARAKSDFLGAMSHEVRTPLNAVLGMAQLLAATPLSPEQAEYLERLRSSGRHLMRLLNDILEFTRSSTSERAAEHLTFRLDQMLANVAASIHARAQAKGLRLDIDLQRDMPQHVAGDAARLEQVLRCFADNAVKFTERGTVRLQAMQQAREARQALLHFVVSDTGIGLSPADQARVFEDFAQADMSATRRHGGTGLSLALARRLAQRMGGEVGFDTRPGAGSSFWCRVRLDVVQDTVAHAAPPAADTAQHAPPAAPAETLEEALQALRRLLSQDDPQATALMHVHGPLLHVANPQLHAQLAASVAAFDFDTALTLLGRIEQAVLRE